MKKLLTLVLAATILFAVSEPTHAQKKKREKSKKSKTNISVHGEKDNNGIYNQRKNTVNEGTAGRSKKRKGSKGKKKDTSYILFGESNQVSVS